jgi:hypothetical protein
MNKLLWKVNNKQCANDEDGYLGIYKIFCLQYDCVIGTQTNKCYILISYLPGIKKELGNFESEEGKKFAEDILKYWIKKAGLNLNEEK